MLLERSLGPSVILSLTREVRDFGFSFSVSSLTPLEMRRLSRLARGSSFSFAICFAV